MADDSISLEEAQAVLREYLAAQTAVLKGQSYSIEEMSFTRANLAEIREGIAMWRKIILQKTRGGIKIKYGVPV